ncbi:MAG: hypothetical protein ACKO8G_00455, partial [Actinomycetota bacterium]
MTLDRASFAGHDCVVLARGAERLHVTEDVGPRILGCSRGGANLLALTPDAALPFPGGGACHLVGGHRLWAAPEVPAITYAPDDAPCAVTEVDGGARFAAPVDAAGLARTIEVRATAEGWSVVHELANRGDAPLEVAPWAITQVRPGGEAFLPLPPAGEPPQADRALVLWPYTDLADARLRPVAGGLVVAAEPGPPTKVGAAPGAGWVSYRIDGEELRIAAEPAPGAAP